MSVQLSVVESSYQRFMKYDDLESSPTIVSQKECEYIIRIPSDEELQKAIRLLQEDMTAVDQLNLNYECSSVLFQSDVRQAQKNVFLLESANGDLIGFMGLSRETFKNPDHPKHLHPNYLIRLEDIYILKEFRGELLSSFFTEAVKGIVTSDAKEVSQFFMETGKEMIAHFSAECVSEAGNAVATEMMYEADTILCSQHRASVAQNKPYVYLGMEDAIGLHGSIPQFY